jgi:D-alanyl-D-alanine dipeptidase
MFILKLIFTAVFIILFTLVCWAQPLSIVTKVKVYRRQVAADSNFKMQELKEYVPTIIYDLRYATANNFTTQKLYKEGDVTFLRLPAVKALQSVQIALAQKGYGLKIFDAYRPHQVTQKMWDLIKDERYVANPAKGSGHNRGLAVDLTIIDLKNEHELDMGTGFDAFTDTAHHTFKDLPESILQNRQLLRQTMEQYGFTSLETEWWHYSWKNDRNYDVLNIDFKLQESSK